MAPASRFTTSKFRNAQLHPATRGELLRGQLPFSSSASSTTASAANSSFSSEIKANTDWVVTVSPSGDLSYRRIVASDGIGAAKVGGGGGVGDWDLSRLDDGAIAVGGLDGKVTLYRLPSSTSEPLQAGQTISVGNPVTHALLHPTTHAILLVSTSTGHTSVYNLTTGQSLPLQLKGSKALWDLSWSPCGRFVGGIGKDGLLSIWEPRAGAEAIVTKQMSLMQPLKPARLEWVKDTLFLSSFSRSRDRQYTLHATEPSRNLETLAQQTIDQNTAVLKAVCDQERGIVYACGRGDMTLRQIELGGPSGFIETIHPMATPLASSSLALAHPSTLPVMQAQIGTLLLPITDKDGDAIQPTEIKVPRRQLIDYHEELFPDIMGDEPVQTADEWWAGGDAAPPSWTLDPARRHTWESRRAEKKMAPAAPASVATVDTPALGVSSVPPTNDPSLTQAERVPLPAHVVSSSTPTMPSPPPVAQSDLPAPDAASPVVSPPAAKSAESPAPTPVAATETAGGTRVQPTQPASEATASASLLDNKTSEPRSASSPQPPTTDLRASTASSGTIHKAVSNPGAAFNPTWSRKFLGAKASLIPSYDQLPPLSSLHPDSLLLQTSQNHLFFPIAGPGGRLAVHPRKAKGRMPVGGRGYLTGGVEMSGFAVDPFADRVAVAGEDGAVRVWTVPTDGFEGVGPEPEMVLKGKSVDRIAQVAFHPTASDLLVVATNDIGKAHLRFWDLATQQEELVLPLEVTGIFNFSFNVAGDRIAIATKDRRVLVLDPRAPSSQVYGKAHESPRSFQLAWVNANHLLSVGFSSGSQRKIQLYRIAGDEIKTIETVVVDVSPSVLFPVYDLDTAILYIWGRGERAVQAYQIDVGDGAKERVIKLPAYTGPNAQLGVWFGPKTQVDVRKVEVGRCWRLTAKTIEEVSFSIPRNKVEFFQDDIFVPTLDVEHPALSASEWLSGQNKGLALIDLCPDDLKPLSEAPKAQVSSKPKFVPGATVISEEEREREEMEKLFQKAKMDVSESESEDDRGIPAPDDDW